MKVAAWIDGAMPQRPETAHGYVQGIHALWAADEVVMAAAYLLGFSPEPRIGIPAAR